MESPYKYMKTNEDKTEMRIACHMEAREFVHAARLADSSGKLELRDAVCNLGILYGHKSIRKIEEASGTRMTPGAFGAIAQAYRQMSDLSSIKGDREMAKEYTEKKESAERLSTAIESLRG